MGQRTGAGQTPGKTCRAKQKGDTGCKASAAKVSSQKKNSSQKGKTKGRKKR